MCYRGRDVRNSLVVFVFSLFVASLVQWGLNLIYLPIDSHLELLESVPLMLPYSLLFLCLFDYFGWLERELFFDYEAEVNEMIRLIDQNNEVRRSNRDLAGGDYVPPNEENPHSDQAAPARQIGPGGDAEEQIAQQLSTEEETDDDDN